eukprot:SM004127S15623  [mRNA]  locus=s4127:87:598:+ [translate_table: standard]
MIVRRKVALLAQAAIAELDTAAAAVARASIGGKAVAALAEAAAALRAARTAAEAAFLHPSLAALRYFPMEHHLAVYTPQLVPVAVHAVVAFTKETRRWRHEQARHAAYTAARSTPS